MSSVSTPISERAARTALATFRAPADVHMSIAAVGAVETWQRLAAQHTSGPIAEYQPEAELRTAQLTAEFVLPGEDHWPGGLAALQEDCPLGLWVRGTGDLRQLSENAVAVTGGRAASQVGTACAADVGRELVAAGRTVVSMLSHGIDTAVQQAARASGSPTLAVLPCGLDTCHPRSQAELMMAVRNRGGVAVSAYRPGTPAGRNSLAYSAQLLAALSDGLVLVEPSADTMTVPLEAASAAAGIGCPVFHMTATGPGYELSRRGKTRRLLRAIGARRTENAAALLDALA
ncbi:DNA-processing protein DprA [Streptomyces sp. CA-251247]|uniref:DNA-processing protein DprA n=1 Tax=Streptomyces sp. CA-251247 TaxID=3240062 RepID=UPI003D93585A